MAVRPDFELDAGSTAAVARICRALDGMPLAIELAAVWLRTLSPAQLAERLDERFALLTGGSRTALPRHRTLRAVVDWSWDLLAALRLAITRRDGDTALRFVRALGWYWTLRGQPGEQEALARDVLGLESRERSPRIAEARIVCALTAAGPSWEIDAVQPALTAAVADFTEWTHGEPPSNPVAAMGEPMLALYDRDPERAFAIFDRYMASPDPWVRAAAPLLRASFGRMVGRIEWAESGCRESLAAFRALGEAWGAASVLFQLAELAQAPSTRAAWTPPAPAAPPAACSARPGSTPPTNAGAPSAATRRSPWPQARSPTRRAPGYPARSCAGRRGRPAGRRR